MAVEVLQALVDGTVAIDMDPLSLLVRLAMSVPPPPNAYVRRLDRNGQPLDEPRLLFDQNVLSRMAPASADGKSALLYYCGRGERDTAFSVWEFGLPGL